MILFVSRGWLVIVFVVLGRVSDCSYRPGKGLNNYICLPEGFVIRFVGVGC